MSSTNMEEQIRVPESTEMSVLLSPTRSKSSTTNSEDRIMKPNGCQNESLNRGLAINYEESTTMPFQGNDSRFKIKSIPDHKTSV